MRIVPDYYSTLQNSSDLLSSNNKTQTSETSSGTTKKVTADSSDTKNTTTTTGSRETYGLDTIKRMTDEEYAAFQRATANMSPNEKMQAAQSLHLVAKSFEEAQKLLSGGGLAEIMSGNSEGYFKSNPDMIDKGISVLSQMSSGEGKSMASFLTSYKGALSSKGLNLSA